MVTVARSVDLSPSFEGSFPRVLYTGNMSYEFNYNFDEFRTLTLDSIGGVSEYSVNAADQFDRDYIEDHADDGDFISVYRAADYN